MQNKFPEGFLWGSATASYQIEGGIENNDWAKAAREGKVPPAGRACDHWNKYEEDFNILKELGQNAYRFSVEWSRIEPEEGKFDESALIHYGEMIQALKKRGIEPFLTLWHFTVPIWFEKKGGFASAHAPEIFARYALHVISKLGGNAGHVITINEPMIWSTNGYLRGCWPPFARSPIKYLRAIGNLARSHRIIFTESKKIFPNLKIGIAKNNLYFHANWNPLNKFAASFMRWFWNRRFLNKIKHHQDFIGVNYYMHKLFGGKLSLPQSDMGWDIFPEGLGHVLLELKRYRKPIYVTENGIADRVDSKRAAFIQSHVLEMKRAIDDGADVRGYFYWSLLDNFEWAKGFGKRFGLVEIDYTTLKRTVRPSAYAYKKICLQNGIDADHISKA